MSYQFSLTNGKQKRFSIDDAFEEETDEAIKVYGTTGPRSPMSHSHSNGILSEGDHVAVNMENGRYFFNSTIRTYLFILLMVNLCWLH